MDKNLSLLCTDHLYNFLEMKDDLGDSVKKNNCDLCGIKDLIFHRKSLFRDTDDVDICFLQCQICNKYISVWVNHQWCSLESMLEDHTQERKQGITEARSPEEKVTVFVLSQIYHNLYDVDVSKEESPFLPFSKEEKVKLVWSDGKAVGFYSLKLKGSLLQSTNERYSMNMVDTMYVLSSYRRRGFAMLMLDDIVATYPNEYIGFAEPISDKLKCVLLKFLKENRKLRDMLWTCSFNGEEGYRENLWFSLYVGS